MLISFCSLGIKFDIYIENVTVSSSRSTGNVANSTSLNDGDNISINATAKSRSLQNAR